MPDPLGRACIFPLEGEDRYVTVVDVCIIRTSADVASPEFLTSAINFLGTRKQIDDLQTGTTRKRISRGNLANVTIPLPPLPEQKRIVAKIEELFSELEAGEESLRVARRQLGVYRQSLLKQAFEGKLTALWRTQNPAKLESPAKLPETEGSHALPGGWRWIKLGSAIEEPAYGTSKKCSYESGGVGVLRIPNVVNGAIEADDLKFAEFTDDERKSYELRSGDLLLIRSNGSVSIVGRCAIVEPKHTGFLYAGYLIRLRPRSTLLDSRFVLRQFASHRLRSQIEFSAKSTSGVNNINSKEIQRLVIAIPSLPEQQEIVRLLDSAVEAIERNER
jgi:type I restriction enzyme S subunit